MRNIAARMITTTAASLLLFNVQVAQAQSPTYPNKPIRIIVAYAAGQGTDVATRLLGEQLADGFEHAVLTVELVLRQLGIGGIGIGPVAVMRGDFEQVFLRAFDLDLAPEREDRAFHLLGAGHFLPQAGAANHLFQVDRAGQRLLHPLGY